MAVSGIKMNVFTSVRKWDSNQTETPDNLARDFTQESIAGATELRFLLYKRRWYGVLIWVLINLMTSWAWLAYSPISSASAKFYNTSENSINTFSIAYMASLCACCPIVIWTMHHAGFRITFLIGAGGLTLGGWLRYAGSKTSPPSYALTMVGQVIIGMTGAVPLALPSHYTDLWFNEKGKVTANAIMSLSNPTGAVLAQVIGPMIVNTQEDVPTLSLYFALICSAVTILSIWVPSKPPTPPMLAMEEGKLHPKAALLTLAKNPRFWLFFVPFVIFVGFFNAISTLLFQIMSPRGVSSDVAGYLGATLIGCGLLAAIVLCPIIDRFRASLIAMQVMCPIIGLCYLTWIWIPGQPIIAAYVVLGVLGGASFTLLPVTLEWLANDTRLASPEVSSLFCWMGGQFLGVVFTLIMQSFKTYGDPSVPDGDMLRALIFQGVLSMACTPLPLFYGFFINTGPSELQNV